MMRYKSPHQKTDHQVVRSGYLARWSSGVAPVAPSTDTGYLIIWPEDEDRYMRGDDEQHQKKTD
jgi:hypothetical protein